MSIARKFKNDIGCDKRVKYTFGKNHDHKCDQVLFVGGNVFSSTAEDLEKEMEIPTDMRAAATGKAPGRCGAHYMLSLAVGETLHPAQWLYVLHDTMRRLGYTEEHKYYGIIHNDTDKQHMHIVANRTSLRTFNLVPEGNDYDVLMRAARSMEQKYGLTEVPNPGETWGTDLTKRDMASWAKENQEKIDQSGSISEGAELWRNRLIALVATSIEQTRRLKDPNLPQFVKLLNKKNVGVEFTYKKGTDDIVGINYIFEGKKISGRKLKRSRLTFQKLTDLSIGGIKYDKKKHLQALQGVVQEKFGRSDAERHVERLQKRRSGGNLPTGVTSCQSTVGIGRGPELSRCNSGKAKDKKKDSEPLFAIRVEMPRYNWSLAQRIMPPTRIKGNYLFYVFKKPGYDVRVDKEVNFIIGLMNTMLDTVRNALSFLQAKCVLEVHSLRSELDRGPTYECQHAVVAMTPSNHSRNKVLGRAEQGLSSTHSSTISPRR